VCIRPFALVQQGLTRAIVNPETLSNSVSRSDSHHEGIHTSTGYQAVVNHLLEKVMGQMGSYGTGVFGESIVSD